MGAAAFSNNNSMTPEQRNYIQENYARGLRYLTLNDPDYDDGNSGYGSSEDWSSNYSYVSERIENNISKNVRSGLNWATELTPEVYASLDKNSYVKKVTPNLINNTITIDEWNNDAFMEDMARRLKNGQTLLDPSLQGQIRTAISSDTAYAQQKISELYANASASEQAFNEMQGWINKDLTDLNKQSQEKTEQINEVSNQINQTQEQIKQEMRKQEEQKLVAQIQERKIAAAANVKAGAVAPVVGHANQQRAGVSSSPVEKLKASTLQTKSLMGIYGDDTKGSFLGTV